MLRIRTSAALTTGLLASILVATPSTGQETDPGDSNPIATVDPTRGAAGSEVTVRGTGCRHQEKGMLGQLSFGFQAGLDEGEIPLTPIVDSRVGPTGAWESTIVIPETIRIGGEVEEVVPGKGYSIIAVCEFETLPSYEWISYDPIAFEVTSGPENLVPPGGSGTETPAPGGSSSPPGSGSGTESGTGSGSPASTPSPAVPIPGTPRTTG
jgi:hypothetical protein